MIVWIVVILKEFIYTKVWFLEIHMNSRRNCLTIFPRLRLFLIVFDISIECKTVWMQDVSKIRKISHSRSESAYEIFYVEVCTRFLNSPIRGIVRKIYFCFSFGFLLARTMAMSLYAASVHDESLLPAPILYSVSDSSYGNEVSHEEITYYRVFDR